MFAFPPSFSCTFHGLSHSQTQPPPHLVKFVYHRVDVVLIINNKCQQPQQMKQKKKKKEGWAETRPLSPSTCLPGQHGRGQTGQRWGLNAVNFAHPPGLTRQTPLSGHLPPDLASLWSWLRSYTLPRCQGARHWGPGARGMERSSLDAPASWIGWPWTISFLSLHLGFLISKGDHYLAGRIK